MRTDCQTGDGWGRNANYIRGSPRIYRGLAADMRNAIWHYNNSFDYVDSVELFARAYRTDPGWLDRMYYWDTSG